jgi:hypothetical protein
MRGLVVLAAAAAACAQPPAARRSGDRPARPTVVGQFSARVVPVDGPAGRSYAFEVIPEAADGIVGYNPLNTIEVRSTQNFAVTESDPLCGNVRTISAPVRIRNYYKEWLFDVHAEITTTGTGNEGCEQAPLMVAHDGVPAGDSGMTNALGLFFYNDIPRAGFDETSFPGKISASAFGDVEHVWRFKFPTDTPFTLKGRVWAQFVPPPAVDPLDFLEAGGNMTWTSLTPNNFATVCEGAGCIASAPRVPVVNVLDDGVVWHFRHAPAVTPGAAYLYRLENTYDGDPARNTAQGAFVATAFPALAGPADGAGLTYDTVNHALAPVAASWSVPVPPASGTYLELCPDAACAAAPFLRLADGGPGLAFDAGTGAASADVTAALQARYEADHGYPATPSPAWTAMTYAWRAGNRFPGHDSLNPTAPRTITVTPAP